MKKFIVLVDVVCEEILGPAMLVLLGALIYAFITKIQAGIEPGTLFNETRWLVVVLMSCVSMLVLDSTIYLWKDSPKWFNVLSTSATTAIVALTVGAILF